jgi:hypothetical protein
MGWQAGYWSASPAEDQHLQVEVSKFSLRGALTSVELYQADMLGHEGLFSGRRPPHKFKIDGMDAIRYYGIYMEPKESCQKFSVYMSDGKTGWVIDCWCDADSMFRLRLLFHRIVGSFSRV